MEFEREREMEREGGKVKLLCWSGLGWKIKEEIRERILNFLCNICSSGLEDKGRKKEKNIELFV